MPNLKLKPQVKTEWVKALRSGEYKQTKYDLQNENGFCCLGVLCDVYAKCHDDLSWNEEQLVRHNGKAVKFGVKGDTVTNVLHPVVQRWAFQSPMEQDAGVNIPAPFEDFEVGGGDVTRSFTALYDLNDNAGYSFERLADVIEAQL